MSIKTRFAPSPTGSLHLGGARTAIFNWLFARHNNGTFVLRIEDTDRLRSTEESVKEITDSLKWLGLDWDEPPVRQSDRLRIYKKYANTLLDEGLAFKCYVTSAELEEKRETARKRGEHFRYRREWAEEKASTDRPYAVRLKAPNHGDIEVNDLLRGTIKFNASEIDDFVILKADGFPTYNFAVVIDDALMEITHIIRGDDHLINTPRQKIIYDALGMKMPELAHVSMIYGDDKTKLSKRHGAVSVNAYREKGYLPEAMINYLARLGWSHGDQEIFTIKELIDKFTLKNVGRSPAVFNPDKLLWLNSHYIRNKPTDELAGMLIPMFRKEGYEVSDNERLRKIIDQLRERSRTLNDFVTQGWYFFTDDIVYNEKDMIKHLTHDNLGVLESVLARLSETEDYSQDNIHQVFSDVMNETGLKLGKIAQPVRVALTGGTVSPGIFDVVEILGKETTLSRLERAIEHIRNQTSS